MGRLDNLPRRVLGDGLVPLDSALGRHADTERSLLFPDSNLGIVYETGHLDLLSSPQVYEKLREWFDAGNGRANFAPSASDA